MEVLLSQLMVNYFGHGFHGENNMSLLLFCNIWSTIAAFIGMILIAHKRREGFYVFVTVETCMAIIGYKTQQYGIIAMSFLYFFCNIYAWWQWRKS
jgi:hypothetical protein